jgi:hypothetical protein
MASIQGLLCNMIQHTISNLHLQGSLPPRQLSAARERVPGVKAPRFLGIVDTRLFGTT